MSARIISFNPDCIILPSSAVGIRMNRMAVGYGIKVEIENFGSYGFPDDAHAAIEVYHPMMPGNQPAADIGFASTYPGKLMYELMFPDIPSSKGTEVRFVVRHPSAPCYLAITERMRPVMDDGEGDGQGNGGSAIGYVCVRESDDIELPWEAIMDEDRPTILVNREYLRAKDVRDPKTMALILPAAIHMWMRGLHDRPDAFNTPAWNAFRDRATACSKPSDDWESGLRNAEHPFHAATMVAEGFWTLGGLSQHARIARKKNVAFLED